MKLCGKIKDGEWVEFDIEDIRATYADDDVVYVNTDGFQNTPVILSSVYPVLDSRTLVDFMIRYGSETYETAKSVWEKVFRKEPKTSEAQQ